MSLLEDFRKLDIDGMACDHNNDLKTVLEAFHNKIVLGGYVDPSILALGSFKDIEDTIRRNIELTKHEPGYIFATNSVNGTIPNDRAEFYYECFFKYAKR